MPRVKGSAKGKRGASERLEAATMAAGLLGRRVRTIWVKRIVALFLMVPAWQLTKTFFTAVAHATTQRTIWLTEEFWFFGLGAALWTCWFFASIWTLGKPEPLHAYVYGHELTHAIWVWLMGGRVNRFEHASSGGFIVTNKSNFWIALAPYFYPIYTMAVVALFAIAGLLWHLADPAANLLDPQVKLLWVPATQWLFLFIGLTWGFHFSFTCWMIPKGQSDLSSHGTFFSLVLIYFVNLVLISFFVIVADAGTSFRGFAGALLRNFEDFSAWVVAWLQHVLAHPPS